MVLQTTALPLGYAAITEKALKIDVKCLFKNKIYASCLLNFYVPALIKINAALLVGVTGMISILHYYLA